MANIAELLYYDIGLMTNLKKKMVACKLIYTNLSSPIGY
jgi:hypothetical protein